MNIDELPKPLALFLQWRLLDLNSATRENLLNIIQNSNSLDYVICVLNLIGGNNYQKFINFCANNPDFEYTSPTDFEVLPPLDVSLNSEQVTAALHDTSKRPLLILAGAGSGKTAVLTRRIVYLLVSGIDATNIMAVTFTNKAAAEMRKRLLDLIIKLKEDVTTAEFIDYIDNKIESAYTMKVGTFHSICYDLLLEKIYDFYNYEIFGYTAAPEILEPVKQKGIIEKIMQYYKINEVVEEMMTDISNCKNELLPPELVNNAKDLVCKKQNVMKVYSEYRKHLVSSNLIDFDDIIFYVVTMLQKSEQLASHYSNRYQYFLIDEYQDTNYAQYMFALKIVEKHKNIFAVGDDDQSIYGWRGADIRNILNFKEDFNNAFIVKFERNYRSSARILEAANNIFHDKDASIRKVLKVSGNYSIGKAGLGEKIIMYQAEDDEDEAEFCKYIITEYVKQYKSSLLEKLNKTYAAINNDIYEATNKMLNHYNMLTEYTMPLWAKTTEWINFYNQLLERIDFDTANKLIALFFDFYQLYNVIGEMYEPERALLGEFFETLKEKMNFLFAKSPLYRNFAIFYRINSQKEIFKKKLGDANIPYIEVGNNKLFSFREIQNIIAMFKIINGYIKDRLKIDHYVNYQQLNLEIVNLSYLPHFRVSDKDRVTFEYCPASMFLISDMYISEHSSLLTAPGLNYLQTLMKLCEDIFFVFEEKKITYILQKINEFLDYSAKMFQGTSTSNVMKKNIEQFRNILLDFELHNRSAAKDKLEAFVKYIVYRSSDQQSTDVYNDGVYLMTLHASKGLEFENVFFTGLEEEVCPYKWPTKDKIGQRELDEEKRLFYVGVTRAQNRLFLTYAKKRKWFNKIVKHKPSRFLKLIPKDLIEK